MRRRSFLLGLLVSTAIPAVLLPRPAVAITIRGYDQYGRSMVEQILSDQRGFTSALRYSMVETIEIHAANVLNQAKAI